MNERHCEPYGFLCFYFLSQFCRRIRSASDQWIESFDRFASRDTNEQKELQRIENSQLCIRHGMYLSKHRSMCTAMCPDMCAGMGPGICPGMCEGICVSICPGICPSMCPGMCPGMGSGMCEGMCEGMCVGIVSYF